ncbi:MAG: alpha/beta hydrolase-fold protein [Trueperaceae bacterium]|nr:alpha/beta hydrolase-fold protein [Trueperaceae bacterium]
MTDSFSPSPSVFADGPVGLEPHEVCVHWLSCAPRPAIDVQIGDEQHHLVGHDVGPGRDPAERRLQARFSVPPDTRWQFRFRAEGLDALPTEAFHATRLRQFWVQDGDIFRYPPAPVVSSSRTEKIPDFTGRLSPRPLYVYLPRGYDEHPDRFYPVLYMHDGQNCFESFVEDSFAGTWRAEEAADRTIAAGWTRECIIVGVANGGAERMREYLPPYTRFYQTVAPPLSSQGLLLRKLKHFADRYEIVVGAADQTAAYYKDDVAPFIAARYRALTGRDHTATCGSSMGALFSHYLAWNHPDFARHHGILSPSYWATKNASGDMEVLERLATIPKPDLRVWLDSGTGGRDTPGPGDDNRFETIAARHALIANGYREGVDFVYHLFEDGTHSEGSWAARFDQVLGFLFPAHTTTSAGVSADSSADSSADISTKNSTGNDADTSSNPVHTTEEP